MNNQDKTKEELIIELRELKHENSDLKALHDDSVAMIRLEDDLLQQTRKNYENFFNTINDFLFILDEKGNIIHTNSTVIDRLGYTREELLGLSVLLVHPSDRRDEAGRIVGEMLRGITEFCPVPIVTKSGIQIPVETRVTLGIWDGKPVIFGVTKDISKVKLSEEKFSKVFYLNPSVCGLSDLDTGEYVEVNDQFYSLLGFEKNEVIGKTATDLGILTTEVINAVMSKADRNGNFYNVEADLKAKNGVIKQVLLSAEIIYIQDKKYKFTVVHDITELKQAEDEISRQAGMISSLLDSIPDIIFFKDQNGVYLGCNPPFAEFVGRSKDEIVGKTDYDLFDKEIADFFRKHDKTMLEVCKSQQNEEWITYPDGRKILIDTLKTPYWGPDGTLIGLLGISRDITERKQAEEEIKKAKIEFEQANLAKSEFLSRMSHELRTPLNSILGFAQLMDMGELTPTHKKGVGHIIKSGKHLLDLINEVLDLSHIEAGLLAISLEPIHLQGIVSETMDVLKPLATIKNITFEFSEFHVCDLFVKADRQKLKQILLNLLSNAVKYNRKGGSLKVECVVRRPKTEDYTALPASCFRLPTIRINIADTGKGISPEYMGRLFNPFERVGSEISEVEGTGLGLAVSKKLIEAMNGTIGVESEPGVGSTFWIELPQTEGQIDRCERKGDFIKPETESVVSGTLLYIEDNVSNIQLVEQILEMHLPQVRLITEMYGKRTVQLAIDYQPEIILLDLDLPDIHGSKVLKQLLANNETKSIPVVILSAYAMNDQIEKLLKAGAKNYLTKPLDVLEFLRVVELMIKQSNKP